MGGGDYSNKKDHYKPYSSYYSGYSSKNDGRGNPNSDKRSGGMRPYSSGSSASSYYPPKRPSVFPKSQGSHYSGSGYNSYSGNGGSSSSMFPSKRKYNSYSSYGPSRSRGSVYIHDSGKSKYSRKDEEDLFPEKTRPAASSSVNDGKRPVQDFNKKVPEKEKPVATDSYNPSGNGSTSAKSTNDFKSYRHGRGPRVNTEIRSEVRQKPTVSDSKQLSTAAQKPAPPVPTEQNAVTQKPPSVDLQKPTPTLTSKPASTLPNKLVATPTTKPAQPHTQHQAKAEPKTQQTQSSGNSINTKGANNTNNTSSPKESKPLTIPEPTLKKDKTESTAAYQRDKAPLKSKPDQRSNSPSASVSTDVSAHSRKQGSAEISTHPLKKQDISSKKSEPLLKPQEEKQQDSSKKQDVSSKKQDVSSKKPENNHKHSLSEASPKPEAKSVSLKRSISTASLSTEKPLSTLKDPSSVSKKAKATTDSTKPKDSSITLKDFTLPSKVPKELKAKNQSPISNSVPTSNNVTSNNVPTSNDVRKLKDKGQSQSPSRDSKQVAKYHEKSKKTDTNHSEKSKKTDTNHSEGSEKKKQKLKETVKKVDLTKEQVKKHSLFQDSKVKPKSVASLMKKSGLFADKAKKSPLFKEAAAKNSETQKTEKDKPVIKDHKKSLDSESKPVSNHKSDSGHHYTSIKSADVKKHNDKGLSAKAISGSSSPSQKTEKSRSATPHREEKSFGPLRSSLFPDNDHSSKKQSVKAKVPEGLAPARKADLQTKSKIRIIDDDEEDEGEEQKHNDDLFSEPKTKLKEAFSSHPSDLKEDSQKLSASSGMESNFDTKSVKDGNKIKEQKPATDLVPPVSERVQKADSQHDKSKSSIKESKTKTVEGDKGVKVKKFSENLETKYVDSKAQLAVVEKAHGENLQPAQAENDSDGSQRAKESLSPRPYTDAQRSSPLSDINISHDQSSDEDDDKFLLDRKNAPNGTDLVLLDPLSYKKRRLNDSIESETPSKLFKKFAERKKSKDVEDGEDDNDEYEDNQEKSDYEEDEDDYVTRNAKISNRASRQVSSDNDEEEEEDDDENDNSEAETVIADYPPKSRRGRGRLVRKSDYDTVPKRTELSTSRERKKPSNASANATANVNVKKTRVGRDASGRLKLQRACDKGKYEIAEQLIEEGADVNDTDYAGNSSLHEAALKGHYDIVQLLIKHGADVNIQSGPEDLDTPLIDAAANGHLDVVKLLLDNGANPNISNAVNENVYELLKDSDEPESKELLEEILKKRDEFAKITLHQNSAAEEQGSGLSSNEADSDDESRSHKRLSRYNQNRNDLFWVDLTSRSGRNEIYQRAAENDFAFVGKYLSGGGAPDTDSLIIASRHGHEEIVSLLLAFGAEVDGVAEDGATALMHSVGRRHLNIVKMLLNGGADPMKKRKLDGKNSLEICQDSLLADPAEIELLKSRMPSHQKNLDEPISKSNAKSNAKSKSSSQKPESSIESSQSAKIADKEYVKLDKEYAKSDKEHLKPDKEYLKSDREHVKRRTPSVPPELSEPTSQHKAKKRKLDDGVKELKAQDDADINMKTEKETEDESEALRKSKIEDNVKNLHKKSLTTVEKPVLKSNKSGLSKDLLLKTSKLFGAKDDKRSSAGDSKPVSEKPEKKQEKNDIVKPKDQSSKNKEAYEQQKAEKIRARQQAVLLRISQAEKQREEEKKLQKIQEDEKRKREQLEAEKREQLLREQLIEEQKQKNISIKKKIRESYPLSLQSVNFYDYNSVDDLDDSIKQELTLNVSKYSPLYYVVFGNEKWVVDLQVNLLSGLANIYDKVALLSEDKVLVKDGQQQKLWNFFGSLLLKDLNSFPLSLRGGSSLSSSSPSVKTALTIDKRLEIFKSEGKKFESLVLNWVKLSTIKKEIINKHAFLKEKVTDDSMIEIDLSFLDDTSSANGGNDSVEPPLSAGERGKSPVVQQNGSALSLKVPRKFQGRVRVLKVVDATRKRMW